MYIAVPEYSYEDAEERLQPEPRSYEYCSGWTDYETTDTDRTSYGEADQWWQSDSSSSDQSLEWTDCSTMQWLPSLELPHDTAFLTGDGVTGVLRDTCDDGPSRALLSSVSHALGSDYINVLHTDRAAYYLAASLFTFMLRRRCPGVCAECAHVL